MQKIVQCSLQPILERFKNVNSNNNSYANVDQLAFAMINVYSEVSQFRNCFSNNLSENSINTQEKLF